ncbi:alpha-(1,3)-fucosyltransferase C-like [Penaeus monodon]|uniref:alpha-(1,3)-fucosyltransferase C-like n=1 Tax=Penaeus monodon TaxID=6687 RepID=UPI0018A7DDA2|nr:alpha-(1,3)-fucosyltransferase C-like [Penaeus monodon]XP_037804726.1 alpha-(1,3)-fucosyltransferase C-like [Penaeus monodon]
MNLKKIIPAAVFGASFLVFLQFQSYETVWRLLSGPVVAERLATGGRGAVADPPGAPEPVGSPRPSPPASEESPRPLPPAPEGSPLVQPGEKSSPLKKVVVLSTRFFRLANSSMLLSQGCPEWRCLITSNASEAESADAVVFNTKFTGPNTVPRKRHAHQRYIWVNHESPVNTRRRLIKKTHFFNWTYTYHTNSDLFSPYGALVPLAAKKLPVRAPTPSDSRSTFLEYKQDLEAGVSLEDDSSRDWSAFLRRPRLAAWMVSHCRTSSHRERYVKKLQEYIPVTVYGRCSRRRCVKSSQNKVCFTSVLVPSYSFYLSFENSICNDYITEKLWNALQYGLVPVVYGGANYSALLPPNSYIDANTLKPEDLAKLLKSIAASPREYGRYHLWRLYWKVVQMWPHCELCYKLHNDHNVTIYSNVYSWWGTVGKCRRSTII